MSLKERDCETSMKRICGLAMLPVVLFFLTISVLAGAALFRSTIFALKWMAGEYELTSYEKCEAGICTDRYVFKNRKKADSHD